ncbi:MAG: BON domain-containing protein [Candidatus Lokiarchaeota archaeon]|nr:BON domain-containing protein [Candidatus Lokiarchaeota archaeon]MBD3338701.1 BON domain-containing protein [Candidatus Lokiarchaeota archaeon]
MLSKIGFLYMSEITEEIKKDIVDQLYWDDRIDASNIKVSVSDGKVTLSGSVPSFSAKNAARADAVSVKGVILIDNQLKVVFPSSVKVPTDEEIKSNIKNALSLTSDINDKNINVDVKDGVVTLYGNINSVWQKVKTEQIVSDMTGVFEIVNELAVVPTEKILDEKIAEDIVAALIRNYNIDVEEIDIKVEDGIVNLYGNVSDWRSYDALINTVRCTRGVLDIDDNLKVQNPVIL